MFLYKNLFFFNIFYSFNLNRAYWNQRRLFSGNLPGMFSIPIMLIGINGGYFPTICRVYFKFRIDQSDFSAQLLYSICSAVIFCSVVIHSYQVPRATKAWPWLASHGHYVVIILQLANNA